MEDVWLSHDFSLIKLSHVGEIRLTGDWRSMFVQTFSFIGFTFNTEELLQKCDAYQPFLSFILCGSQRLINLQGRLNVSILSWSCNNPGKTAKIKSFTRCYIPSFKKELKEFMRIRFMLKLSDFPAPSL